MSDKTKTITRARSISRAMSADAYLEVMGHGRGISSEPGSPKAAKTDRETQAVRAGPEIILDLPDGWAQ